MIDTSAGTRSDAARMTAEPTGLRLCGIVDEPPLPGADGSNASPTSVCISSETSRAILPSVPVRRPSTVATSAMRSRCVSTAHRAASRSSARASAASTRALDRRARRACRRRRRTARRASAAATPAIAPRWRSIAESHPAAFRPNVTGVACCSRSDPRAAYADACSHNVATAPIVARRRRRSDRAPRASAARGRYRSRPGWSRPSARTSPTRRRWPRPPRSTP